MDDSSASRGIEPDTRIFAASSHDGATITFAGIVAAARRVRTRTGDVFEYVTFEDEFGFLDAVIPARLYATLKDPVKSPGPYLATGVLEEDRGFVQLRIETILPFYERKGLYEEV